VGDGDVVNATEISTFAHAVVSPEKLD